MMVQPVEARGQKSICVLLDVADWDTARLRLEELGIKIAYHKNRPVVNIEVVRIASMKWHQKKMKE